MFAKKITPKIPQKNINHYKFHINDPVLCVIKDSTIKNTTILSRNTINGDNFYKIGDNQNFRVCKEKDLINR